MSLKVDITEKCPKCKHDVKLFNGKFIRHNPKDGRTVSTFDEVCWGSGCTYLSGCPGTAYCPSMNCGPNAPVMTVAF